MFDDACGSVVDMDLSIEVEKMPEQSGVRRTRPGIREYPARRWILRPEPRILAEISHNCMSTRVGTMHRMPLTIVVRS